MAVAACADPSTAQRLTLDDALGFVDDPTAIRVVPAAHLPQPQVGTLDVWLRLPPGSQLGVTTLPDGRRSFTYPPGTRADRIEVWGLGDDRRVIDVRGTTIDADGRQWHHVYRPTRRDPAAPLVGAQWLADDLAAQEAGSAMLLEQLTAAGVRHGLDDIAAKNACDSCHSAGRADNRRRAEHGVVARGTDAAGFFTPSTLLAPDVALEAYGSVDLNAADPFVVRRCPDGSTPSARVCAGGAIPRATLALADALAANDPHALAHCATWRALGPHLPEGVSAPAAGEEPR